MKRKQKRRTDRQPIYILDYIVPVITWVVLFVLAAPFLAFPLVIALTNQENLEEDKTHASVYSVVHAKEEILGYANDHLDLLQRCAEELQDRFAEYPVGSYRYCRISDSEIQQTHDNYGAAATSTFQSDTLGELFSGGVIREIQVDARTVSFYCSLGGIAPASCYEMLELVPSGQVTDLFGYDDRMRFRPDEDGGFFGTMLYSDDTLYYLPITDTLFYSVAVF